MRVSIIAGSIFVVPSSIIALFAYGRYSDSKTIEIANRKLSGAQNMVRYDAGAWRTDPGTLFLEEAAPAKLAEQAAESARRAEEAR